jgi:DNA-directed RNA polymerase specialized sigma24 family protein
MKVPLERLYRGELSFEAFVLQTRSQWDKIAHMLLHRWSAPTSVTADDLVQEMLFRCWDLLGKYDPNRGSLDRFIKFRSIDHAKRWLHKQRGAKYYKDKSPSRFPLLYDSLSIEESTVPPDQELAIKRLEKINLASNLKELLILNRLSRIPSIDLVTQELYNDPKIKLYLQFNSMSDARRIVYRSVLKISRKPKTINK